MATVRNVKPRVVLDALARNVRAQQQMRRNAEKVRDVARQLAPVRTGRLRSSIIVYEARASDGTVEFRIGWDASSAPYYWMVEAGTEHSRAQPHLRPAASVFGGRSSSSSGGW